MKIMKFKKTAAVLAAVAVVAMAGPASAAPPYNVLVGASTTGTHAFGAYTKTPFTFVVAGPNGPVTMTCGMSTASGIARAGASSTGLAIAEIQGTAWSACATAGGVQLNVAHVGKWNLNATGVATAALTDNVAGYINNINAVVTSKIPGLCNFTVTGRANSTFNEPAQTPAKVFKQRLTVNETAGNLAISSVSGCIGLLANGNTSTFTGVYQVVTPNGYINITP